MSTTVPVKMAKASPEDITKVREFFQFLEEYFEYGTHTPENDELEEESIDLTPEQFMELLSRKWGGRFKPAGVDSAWSRVVFGCEILIQNVCDPDSDTLEWKPSIAKQIEPPEGIEEALEHLRGNKEHFRQVLLDKNKILASVCDYAERMAKKKRLEPWSIIGDITDHGSGVSSAIYELYRRKPATTSEAR